jgi:hypothetical protein
VSFGYFCNEEVLVYFVLQSAGIVAIVQAIDPFLTDVETAAPFATENGKPTVFFGAASRSVPDFECDAVLLGVASIVVENFATGGIGPSENQSGHRHGQSAPSLFQIKEKSYGEHSLRLYRVVLIPVSKRHGATMVTVFR